VAGDGTASNLVSRAVLKIVNRDSLRSSSRAAHGRGWVMDITRRCYSMCRNSCRVQLGSRTKCYAPSVHRIINMWPKFLRLIMGKVD
jgi:hypothetical protein